MARLIDCMHLGTDRVIGAWERDGVIVDPGPTTCIEALLEGLDGAEPRALLLTHIHLDHAGASGVLARRFPRLKVYVHERGAPHLVDPTRLLRSAARLYGDDMDRLWGEVAPVPEDRVVALAGGETVAGMTVAYTPGHASHHVCFLDAERGAAFCGDVTGVRIPPADFVEMPTPPPDIDLEAWRDSLDTVAGWAPERLHLTHFGAVDGAEGVAAHLEACRTRLGALAERASQGDGQRFLRAQAEEIEALGADPARRYLQAAPPDQLWQGLERYFRG